MSILIRESIVEMTNRLLSVPKVYGLAASDPGCTSFAPLPNIKKNVDIWQGLIQMHVSGRWLKFALRSSAPAYRPFDLFSTKASIAGRPITREGLITLTWHDGRL